MTNTERDKAIWEGLGECWHVLDDDLASSNFGSCLKCKAELLEYALLGEENPDFSSDSGKVMLLREMEKLPNGKLFFAKLIYSSLNVEAIDDDGYIPRELITDETGKLADAVYEWLVQTGRR